MKYIMLIISVLCGALTIIALYAGLTTARHQLLMFVIGCFLTAGFYHNYKELKEEEND